MKSARDDATFVDEALAHEVSNGYVLGPFDVLPFTSYRVNPLGVAIGKYSGKKRLIVDLSSPRDDPLHTSINELIDKDDFSLSYVRLDDALQAIKRAGRGAWLNKTDIVDAFKLMPVRPHLWPFYSVKWRDKYYCFCRLAFGSRSSPKLFDLLSQAVCFIASHNYGIECIFAMLDDFLTVDKPSIQPERTMALLTHIFGILKIPLSPKKTVGPTTELEYLGIILDTVRMESRLPLDKLTRIRDMLDRYANCKTCTKRELLSLLGHLQYAARVVVPGRSFVSHLIQLSTTVQKLHHRVKLNKPCQMEMQMWARFLQSWNGVSMFLDETDTLACDMELYTDASMKGFAGYCQGQWFQSHWPDALTQELKDELSMSFMELYPIVVSAILWDKSWKGKRIRFNCDNAATVQIINKGRSRSAAIMTLMRHLTFRAATGNYIVLGTWLPGMTNGIADALSHFEQERFRRLAGL